MMNKFIPCMYQKSIFDINYPKLKKDGVKCLLFDLDNTISPAKKMTLDDEIKKLFENLKKDFIIVLFSNNRKKRVNEFATYYDTEYLHMTVKPLPFSYYNVLKKHHLGKTEVAAVGDQLLTDILGGNTVGIKTILIDPICKEDEKITFLNRKIETAIFNKFKKKNILVKGNYYD